MTNALDAAPPIAVPAAASASHRRTCWMMVVAAMLGTMCCSTSVVLINVGLFMKPLGESFGWSRGAIAASLSIAALAMAAANPFVGRLIDRYGAKTVLLSSLALYGVATALTPLLVGWAGIMGLYLAYALIAGLGAGSNVIAYVRILSGWFAGPMDGRRGLALGISSAGIPLGAAVSGPLAVEFVDRAGWQGGYLGLAALPLIVGLLIAWFLRTAPGDAGDAAARATAAQLPGMTVSEAVRTRPFWLLIGVVLLMSGCLQGLSIHAAPYLSDHGLSADGLALFLSILGIVGIVGRVGAGFLFDHFFAPRVSIVIFAVAAASALILASTHDIRMAVIASVLLALGGGAESDLVGLLVGRYFGLRAYGQLFGYIYGAFMVGVAVGPYLFGVAFDHFHSYRTPFTLGAAGIAVICVLLALMPRVPEGGARLDSQAGH